MFYIAAYGFINLAYTLESWANPDFRPSLKIPKWVGIIGFIASMGVMFKINTLAMIVSLLIIFAIYIILKRREVQGNMSNVWQSVWNSLVRSSLHKISQNPLNEKNWEPNIILFSGGTNVRTYLLDLGSNFVGDHGFLSNFDLKVIENERFLFAKKDQNISSEISEKYPGVYTRQQAVKNLYEGIEIIAQTYGFSGVEPNTVMMGWARQSADPIRFVQSINNLVELDMNVLLVDYDKKRGFGEYKRIDIWWRGGSQNGNLALYFSKFLLNSDAWSGASIRLMIVNEKTDLSAPIHELAKNMLENLRIQADIIVIDNEIEQKHFYEIIEKESLESDLTFLGFPELEEGKEQEFVEKTNNLCRNIGTVVMIKSSSLFKEMHLGEFISNEVKEYPDIQGTKMVLEKPQAPRHEALAASFEDFTEQLQNLHSEFLNKKLTVFEEFHQNIINQLLKAVDHSFQNLNNRFDSNQTIDSFKKVIAAQHSLFLRGQNQYIKEFSEKQIPKLAEDTLLDIAAFIQQVSKIAEKTPLRIRINLTRKEIQAAKALDKETAKAKFWLKPLWLILPKFMYYVNFQSLLKSHFPHKTIDSIYRTLIEMDQINHKMGIALINSMQNISDIFETLKPNSDQNKPSSKVELIAVQKKIHQYIHELGLQLNENINRIAYHANKKQLDDLNAFSSQLSALFPNAYENHQIDYSVRTKQLKKQLNAFPELYSQNLHLIYNQNILNNGLLQFNQQTRLYLNQEHFDLERSIENNCLNPIQRLMDSLHNLEENNQSTVTKVRELIKIYAPNMDFSVSQQMLDINDARNKKINSAIKILPDKLELYSESLRQDAETTEFYALQGLDASISRTIDYLVEKEISDDLRAFLFKFGPKIQLIKIEFSKVLRQFNMFDEKASEKENQSDWDTFLRSSTDQLALLETELVNRKNELSIFFETKDLHIKKALNLHSFVANLTKLKQYIRLQTQKRKYEKIKRYLNEINHFFETQLNKVWYNQSSGIILARKLSKAILRKETRVDDLLQFKEKVSISESLLNKIPDYYKQLFLRKEFYLKDFWVGREVEFKLALQSFQNYRDGYKGAILVTGESFSGKSFFLNQLVSKLQIQGEVYQISSPFTGSVFPRDLLSSFQIATEKTGSYADILNNIPSESIFLIDDLELWWEKSSNGMQVIDQLMKLIEDFSSRHLFLFACNINAFQLINHYRKIESNFINLIELSPMNAKEIKDVILKRHLSSGMQFKYRKTPESAFRSWNYARLFSRYYNYSEGNIGVALQSWVANITEVENSTIFIRKPSQPDYSIFNYLEIEWMIFIMQFILHKRMNINKLMRITRESEKSVRNKVTILKRAGLIIQMSDGILELNSFIFPYLQKALIQRQLF